MKYSKIVAILILGISLTLTGCSNKKQVQECDEKLTSINKMLAENNVGYAQTQLYQVYEKLSEFNISDKKILNKVKSTQENINNEREKTRLLPPSEVIKLIENKYGKDNKGVGWSFASKTIGYLEEIKTGDVYYYGYILIGLKSRGVKFADVLIKAKTKEFIGNERFPYQNHVDKFRILDGQYKEEENKKY